MGDMAEYYLEWSIDSMIDSDCEDPEDSLGELIDTETWPAKTGAIAISRMSDEHVLSAIRYMKRKIAEGFKISPYLRRLQQEAKDRGLTPRVDTPARSV